MVAMLLNALASVILAIVVAQSGPKVSARFERGFISDRLVLKNRSSSALNTVFLELDGRYIFRIPKISPGVQSFDLQRVFEDSEANRPGPGYVPRRLRIIYEGGEEEIPVARRQGDS